jgi:hypothetical protein
MKINFIFIILSLILITPFVSSVTISENESRALIYEDVHILENLPNNNYADYSLRIDSGIGTLSYTYIWINLTNSNYSVIDNVANNALLYLVSYYEDVPNSTYKINSYYCNDTNGFNESNITWNNAGSQISNCEVDSFYNTTLDGGGLKSIDITDKLNEYAKENFIIKLTLEPTGNYYGLFKSKEYATETSRPRLYIDYLNKIQTNLSDYYNSENISIQLNSLTNMNMSYNLFYDSDIDNPTKDLIGFPFPISNETLSINRYCFEYYGINGGYSLINNNASATIVSYYNGSTWLSSSGLSYTTKIRCELGKTLIDDNVNSTILNLTNLKELQYNITFISDDAIGEVNSSGSFIVDLIYPTITNNIPSEINNYIFNGSWFSCNDTFLYSCNISIDGFNYANGTDFNLTHNGNLTYNITAVDLAGNILIESDILFVNPYFYIYFNTTDATPITNFTINGTSYTDYFYGNIYDYGLGTHSFLFSRLGINDTIFELTFNSTSDINTTFVLSNSKIVVYIYDRDTESLITDNVTIVLVGTYGYNATTDTGNINISGLQYINESYQIISSSDNYESESVYFDFDNREILQVDIYMIKSNQSNLGTHTIRAITDIGQLVNAATCSALEWKPSLSAFVTVAQGETDSNGETVVNVELGTKLYKFYCYKGTASAYSSSNKIISTSGLSTTITLETTVLTPSNTFGDLTYSLTNETLNATHQRITYTWSDGNNLVNTGCLNIYKVIGTKFTSLQSSCVDSSGSSIQLIQNINQTYEIRAVASIEIDSKTTNLGYIKFESQYSLKNSLDDYSLDLVLPLIIILLSIGIGFLLSPKNIYISIITIILGVWLCNNMFAETITTNISIYITIVCLLMMWGAYRFK